MDMTIVKRSILNSIFQSHFTPGNDNLNSLLPNLLTLLLGISNDLYPWHLLSRA